MAHILHLSQYFTIETILATTISLIAYYVINFYHNHYKLPPGPFPLPILGNFGLDYVTRHLGELHKSILRHRGAFKGFFTVYLGPQPILLITDARCALEAFKKIAFSGRTPLKYLDKLTVGPEPSEVLYAHAISHEWKQRRQVLHCATRKFAISAALPAIVKSVVRDVVTQIKHDCEAAKCEQFDLQKYCPEVAVSVVMHSVFGARLSPSDMACFVELQAQEKRLSVASLLLEVVPFARFTLYPLYKAYGDIFQKIRDFRDIKFKEHLANFDEGEQTGDFCDGLIAARRELRTCDADDVIVSDHVLGCLALDLIGAGISTMSPVYYWTLALLASHQDIQSELRREIDDAIGDNDVTLEHMSQCPLANAFVAEVLRLKPPLPTGVPHYTTETTTLGDHVIPAGMRVVMDILAIGRDERYWTEGNKFEPKRFLDSEGKFSTRGKEGFVPYSTGRRLCPGAKFSNNVLFYVLVEFLKNTNGKRIELAGDGSFELFGRNDGFDIESEPQKCFLVIRDECL